MKSSLPKLSFKFTLPYDIIFLIIKSKGESNLNILFGKFKEVLYSVLPITTIVILLNFTISPLETNVFISFLIGALLIILGLTVLLSGIDIGITPFGNLIGSALTKYNKLWIVIISGLILGFFISIAEPDLHVLAGQVDIVTKGAIPKLTMVAVVSVGIAAMMTLGIVRILYNIKITIMLLIVYLFIFVISLFTTSDFLAIAFDASGATTGAMTTPFILAVSIGISALKKDSKSSEDDSFGLVGITSSGAIIAVILMSLFFRNGGMSGGEAVAKIAESDSIFLSFLDMLPTISGEVALALLPLIVIFVIFQIISFKLKTKSFFKIVKGFLYTFLGMVLFLVGVNAGFMNVASTVGHDLASMDNKAYVIIVGFVLGLVTILAEPAVYVLNEQVENVTSGSVKRKVILIALSAGVGVAVALSVLRVLVPGIKLWHYLLPGYILALILSFFTPDLFVGIAFDSGGVASGPMTATFILAFIQGAAQSIESANVLIDGFGMIAMVALAPLITLQILGLIYKAKTAKEGVNDNALNS